MDFRCVTTDQQEVRETLEVMFRGAEQARVAVAYAPGSGLGEVPVLRSLEDAVEQAFGIGGGTGSGLGSLLRGRGRDRDRDDDPIFFWVHGRAADNSGFASTAAEVLDPSAITLPPEQGPPLLIINSQWQSGVMGAFSVRYWNVKMCILPLSPVITRPVWMPAWAILGFWFLTDLFSLPREFEGSTVAYLDHVGGFAFGVIFALTFRVLKVEERWLAPLVARKSERVVISNSSLDEALWATATGRAAEAWADLRAAVERSPGDPDAALALWVAAEKLEREGEAATVMCHAIERELRSGQVDFAISHWRELRSRVPDARLNAVALVRLAQALTLRHQREEAIQAIRDALDAARAPTESAILRRIADAARGLDAATMEIAASRLLDQPDLDIKERQEAERLLILARRQRSVPVMPSSSPPH